jgi:hypothetical protein
VREDKRPSGILSVRLNGAKSMRGAQAAHAKSRHDVTPAIYMRAQRGEPGVFFN